MSEEEKKEIIKKINELQDICDSLHIVKESIILPNGDYLNLFAMISDLRKTITAIENQQKEIEELKKENILFVTEKEDVLDELEHLKEFIQYLKDHQIYLTHADRISLFCIEKYIKQSLPKSKIKEKIKEYDGLKIIDKTAWEEQVKPLIELLEEDK